MTAGSYPSSPRPLRGRRRRVLREAVPRRRAPRRCTQDRILDV